ncbi:MAG: hypothetical protein KTR30_33095 [Saprospiraceae bacterium]|nr:hypothetical protein [Saprospiraceae bacterium]
MLRTWLVFVGLTMLWIMTRSIYLESWTSVQSESAIQQSVANSCPSCVQLLKTQEVSIATDDHKRLAILQDQLQSCRAQCPDYTLLERQLKERALSTKYQP